MEGRKGGKEGGKKERREGRERGREDSMAFPKVHNSSTTESKDSTKNSKG
jgi:hypothetical protein